MKKFEAVLKHVRREKVGAKTQKIFRGNLISLTQGMEIVAPDWIQLLPKGSVTANEEELLVDDQALKEILENFSKRKNDLVLDYEHQTLTGEEAPAAGWIVDLEIRADGLWAKVNWTARGKQYVESREYRYISPVVFYRDSDKRGYELQNAALTNNPAIDGMQSIVAKQNKGGTTKMNLLEQLIGMLGLAPEATEEEAADAVAKLLESGGGDEINTEEITAAVEEAVAEVEASIDSTLESVEEAVAEVESAAVEGDKVAVARASAKAKRIIAKARNKKIAPQILSPKERSSQAAKNAYATMAVEAAITAGKITPAQKSMAMRLALGDAKAFSQFIQTAPKSVALGAEYAGGAVRTGKVISHNQKEANRRMGISDEEFEKYGGKGQ